MNSSFLSPHFGLIPLVLFSSLLVLNQETRKVLFQQPLPIHPGWLTLRSNQKSPINLMFMFLERGRKPEHLEKTHTGMSRTQEGLDRSWTWNILATLKGETLERVSPDLQMTSSRDCSIAVWSPVHTLCLQWYHLSFTSFTPIPVVDWRKRR